MTTIKKLEAETIIRQVQFSSGVAGLVTRRSVTWAVIDAQGHVVFTRDGQPEIYKQKGTAQAVADWYNKQ